MKPCKDCPFRSDSLKGWIGTFESAEAILKIAVSEMPFSCHTKTDDRTSMLDINEPQCVGRLIFASNSAKIFRDPRLEELRLQAKACNERSDVLGMMEFVPHHTLKEGS